MIACSKVAAMANPKLVAFVASVAGVIGASEVLRAKHTKGNNPYPYAGVKKKVKVKEIEKEKVEEPKYPDASEWDIDKGEVTAFTYCLKRY